MDSTKEIRSRFAARSQQIYESTWQSFVQESDEDKQKRIASLLKDYGAFVSYYFPAWATSGSGKFHIAAANRTAREGKLMGVFEWARGHAKSTHFDIMIPLWLKAKKMLHVMVLVGKNEKNAQTLLSDLQAELQNNRRYIADFGEQLLWGNWEDGRFATQDGCGFFALGRGQSPRGIRYRQHRPDYIVLDDVDDDELCRNPDRVTQITDWALKALYFAMDMGRGRFIVVGNRISHNSLVARLADMPGVYHDRVNAMDEKGNPAWPEKYTKEEIQAVADKLGYRASQQELFNNPITEGAVFKRDWIIYAPAPRINTFNTIISYCDPSFKNSRTSDYKAIITIGRKDKNYYIINSFVRKCSIGEMVRYWLDFHQNLPQTALVGYYMEANFLQDLILDEFQKEGVTRGWQFPVRADARKKPDKFARIEAISPLFERNLVLFDERLKTCPDTERLIDQLLSFEKGSRTHDDGPDAVEGAIWIINNKLRESTPPVYLKRNPFSNSKRF